MKRRHEPDANTTTAGELRGGAPTRRHQALELELPRIERMESRLPGIKVSGILVDQDQDRRTDYYNVASENVFRAASRVFEEERASEWPKVLRRLVIYAIEGSNVPLEDAERGIRTCNARLRASETGAFAEITVHAEAALFVLGAFPWTTRRSTSEEWLTAAEIRVHDLLVGSIRAERHPASQAISEFEQLGVTWDRTRQNAADELQELLARLNGPNHAIEFRTPDEKKAFARSLQRLLKRLGLRLRCPECGGPSAIRGGVYGNSKQGVFRFEHSAAGKKISHATTTDLPRLTVLAPVDNP